MGIGSVNRGGNNKKKKTKVSCPDVFSSVCREDQYTHLPAKCGHFYLSVMIFFYF